MALTASALSVLLTLASLEVAVRGGVYLRNRNNFRHLRHEAPGAVTDLATLVRPSEHADLIYELRPDADTTLIGVPVRTNSSGWRGRPYPAKKDGNAVRIVGLGDSYMFGWGVRDEQKYTSVLEELMNSRFPRKTWELVNTAVPGYNTVMEVESFARKGVAYDPDIVLLEYIGNDLDLPNFLLEPTDYLTLRKSFLLELVAGRIDVLRTSFGLRPTPVSSGGLHLIGIDETERVPAEYRHMVGWPACEAALRKLKQLQRKHGFEVVICVTNDRPHGIVNDIARLSKELGFHAFFDEQPMAPGFVLSRTDPHPTARAHARKAHVLFDQLARSGLIEKLAKQAER